MPKPSTPTTTTTKDKDKPRKSSGSISTPKKSPLKSSNSQEGWWEADEILDQKGKRYLVSWVGTNPETGRAYSPTWVYSLLLCRCVLRCFNCEDHRWLAWRNPRRIVIGNFSIGGDIKRELRRNRNGRVQVGKALQVNFELLLLPSQVLP